MQQLGSETGRKGAVVVGNGPVTSEVEARNVLRLATDRDFTTHVANFFFLNPIVPKSVHQVYVTDLANKSLLTGLSHALSAGGSFSCRAINVPNVFSRLESLRYLVHLQINYFWLDLVNSGVRPEIFMRGSQAKLPTLGFQMIHNVLTQGAAEVWAVGLNLYSDKYRAHNFPSEKAPGYSIGAHSLQTDVDYLLSLAAGFNFRLIVFGVEGDSPWFAIRELWEGAGLTSNLELRPGFLP